MSVLSDHWIKFYVRSGRIGITPYNEDQVQPASYDVRLDQNLLHVWPTDSNQESTRVLARPYVLMPGNFLLGSTIEHINVPREYVARLEGKSTNGRAGLIVHATAGYIDPGFRGQITLEISCFAPVTLVPGMLIGQISFQDVHLPVDNEYHGKYQDQEGPTPAR